VKKLIFLFAFLIVGVAAAAPNVVSTTETSATVAGLECGTKYRFEIRKYTANGDLSPSADYVDAQTKSCPDTGPPSQPQNLAATGASQTSISVSWTASTDDIGVTAYDLFRGGNKVDSTTGTSYTFGELSCGTSYVLAVEARDAAGNRSVAAAINASTAACPPPTCPAGEYSTQYFGNTTLSGTAVLQRCETAINHDWGTGSPAAGVPTNQFSARWTGTHSFSAGTYQFTATADDGIRVWVDGALVIDSWREQPPTTYQATRSVTAGNHDVKVEYYENGGGAVARVSWQLNTPPPPPPTSCPTGQYSAQYHGNMTLAGTPVLQRCETALNSDWGSGSPHPGVPTNQFSARWTGTFSFAAGTYQFSATADDGIRIWVDGAPLIDAWRDQPASTYQATKILTAGDHAVKVEYYENGGFAVARLNWQLSQVAPTPPPTPPPPSGPPPPGVVLQPGQSWNGAYQQARCGDTIRLAAGTHPTQTITENPSLSTCAEPVTFQPVDGAQVTVNDHVHLGSCRGCYSRDAPSHLVFRGFAYTVGFGIWGDASDILLDKLNGGGFFIQGVNGVTVRDSDFGPCNSSPPSFCSRAFVNDDRGNDPTATRNVLIERNVFHDFRINVSGDHWECMFTTGGTNVTIRGNHFYNCETYAIATGARPYSDYENWVIENNWFGRTCCFGTSDRSSSIVMGGSVPVSDMLIRFNSFAPGQAVVTEGGTVGPNVRVLGNILGAKTCVAGISYSYNLTLVGACSSTDRTVAVLPYVNLSLRGDGDYHLIPGSPAESFVTAGSVDANLAVDKDGDARGLVKDAGSDER
jgi:PA14 domain